MTCLMLYDLQETQLASEAVAEQPPANKGDLNDAEDDVIIATEIFLTGTPDTVSVHIGNFAIRQTYTEISDIQMETQLASQPVAEHSPENKDDSKEAKEDVFIATEHPQISETPSQPLQAAPSEDSMDTAPASNDSLTPAKETQSASQAVAEQRGEDKVGSKESEDEVVVATEETQLASEAVAEQPPANKGDLNDAEDDVIIATEETQLASQPVAEYPPENEGDSKEAEEDVIIASEHPQISEIPAQPLQATPSEDSIAAAPASADSLTPAKVSEPDDI
ncbi:unnamed protein product [Dibothriocephalus latus]|uniref:Uncharacterized protein n=1 Tax=Dibothriocephalus latus TaxID=60516 RepID=A0A3P6PDB3_DIBLA|nr:unnamed protein product [Dibothriocephalus latus]